MALPTLNLGPKLEQALASGHPWVYRNHLPKHNLMQGDWVRLEAGKETAIGLYDSDGQIGVRVFSRDAVPERAWVETRVREAIALRREVFKTQDTNAYRVIYGEGDNLPGLVVDLYERFAVLRTYAGSVERLIEDVVRTLHKELNLRGVVRRTPDGLEPLWGQAPPPEVTVTEHGLRLIANLYEGQKTGLFLDHRENRRTLEGYSAGRTVLNLFSYTGAFSLYAARGGATRVTSVDIAPAATEDAKRNFSLNGFDVSAHEFITADVFELLERYAREGRTFDVVVLDPPSLARNKQSRFAAQRAYRKLNMLATRCVTPGGFLATASCTSQVSPAEFVTLVGEAGHDAKRRLQLLHEAGHAPDHPVPATFPEGRYLKFILVRVLPLT